MIYTTRTKLIASFLGVSFLVGAVSLLFGGQLLYRAVLSEATNRVKMDLNAARGIYLKQLDTITCPLSMIIHEPAFRNALAARDISGLALRLRTAAGYASLDFAGIMTADNQTIIRVAGRDVHSKATSIDNPIADLSRDRLIPVSGAVIVDRHFLAAHNPELAHRARIVSRPTPRAVPQPEAEETSGMALAYAAPVFNDDDLIGIVYGGILLNRNETIVDTIKNTVFHREMYKNSSVGTATIFFNDLRVATNVLTPDGRRAIGTRVSMEVKKQVLLEGKKWIDRAFVVSDWYITGYEPIVDIFNRRVGMLYVGVLEAKYADIQRNGIFVFILFTLAGIALAICLGSLLAHKIMRPISRLINASKQVSNGNLSPAIGPIAKDEMGLLQNTFKDMLSSIEERDKRTRAASEYQLLMSEKQASIGKLAAGVAHEINNPLTGVLTYTYMLLRRTDIPADVRNDLQTIAKATDRVRKIVKGLLDFSRQTRLEREPTEVNKLVSSTIRLMDSQALVKGVRIQFRQGDGIPIIIADRSKAQSVLLNIIINALDATEPGGTISISTASKPSPGNPSIEGVEIIISDTGCGIPKEDIDRLFDPFFTTKEVGRGTGLGLAVSIGIIQRHGGTIRVQSAVGKGSTFFIWIPIEKHGE